MSRSWLVVVFMLCSVLLVGCATTPKYQWRAKFINHNARNSHFKATLDLFHRYSRYEAFKLYVTNRTDEDLEVNWNKTLYVVNGRTFGGFMFAGIIYKDRNNQKPPDVIFPKTTWNKIIWPNALVRWARGKRGGWLHDPLPEGENGVYLVVNVNGKEIKERIFINLSKEPVGTQ